MIPFLFARYVGQDKNPLGFGNWQRGENEMLVLFSTSEPILCILMHHPARRTKKNPRFLWGYHQIGG
jgi:hypothetical protein